MAKYKNGQKLMCEDYRAAASIDLEHDRADRQMEKMLQMPVHVLWCELGCFICSSWIRLWRGVSRSRGVFREICGSRNTYRHIDSVGL